MANNTTTSSLKSPLTAEERCNKKLGYRWNPNTESCEKIEVVSPFPSPTKSTETSSTPKDEPRTFDLSKGLLNQPAPESTWKDVKFDPNKVIPVGKVSRPDLEPETTPTLPDRKSVVIRDSSGKLTGYITAEGKTILNLKASEVRAMAEDDARKYETPIGTIEASELAAQERTQRENLQLLSGDSQGTQPTSIDGTGGTELEQGQVSSVDMRQARLAIFSDPNTIQSVAVTGFVGAKAGAAVGGPWGAAIGAIGAAGLTLLGSMNQNIKSQRTDNLAAQKTVLTDGKLTIDRAIALMNVDKDNASAYLEFIQNQRDNINKAYSQMQIDTQSAKNLRFGLDGTRELQRFENYFGEGGLAEIQDAKIGQALVNPNFEEGMLSLMMSQDSIGE